MYMNFTDWNNCSWFVVNGLLVIFFSVLLTFMKIKLKTTTGNPLQCFVSKEALNYKITRTQFFLLNHVKRSSLKRIKKYSLNDQTIPTSAKYKQHSLIKIVCFNIMGQ